MFFNFFMLNNLNIRPLSIFLDSIGSDDDIPPPKVSNRVTEANVIISRKKLN